MAEVLEVMKGWRIGCERREMEKEKL